MREDLGTHVGMQSALEAPKPQWSEEHALHDARRGSGSKSCAPSLGVAPGCGHAESLERPAVGERSACQSAVGEDGAERGPVRGRS